MARDSLFRTATSALLERHLGQTLTRQEVAALLDEFSAGRLSPGELRHTAGNVLSSWAQTGLIASVEQPCRQAPLATATTCAFALFLGWLEGGRGQLLLRTAFAQLVAEEAGSVLTLASHAAQRGLLELLNAGGVVEIRFPGYLTISEAQLP